MQSEDDVISKIFLPIQEIYFSKIPSLLIADKDLLSRHIANCHTLMVKCSLQILGEAVHQSNPIMDLFSEHLLFLLNRKLVFKSHRLIDSDMFMCALCSFLKKNKNVRVDSKV